MSEKAVKIVTKISANKLMAEEERGNSVIRVAAYCRVSTDSEDQLQSYKAQVEYYTDVIAKNPQWRLAGIYADEGITGTKTTKRVNFNRMIKDCEKGKIDMIITKSVARFARNTVDSLNYTRKLKSMGIGVYFEEQGLNTLKADSEMFIGLHSVLAQAESENISANVRWGIQQRMKTGTFKFRYNLLGYRKGINGEPEIVEDEAEVIRKIYDKYLNGESLDQIKVYLEVNNIKTVTGNNKWSKVSLKNILTNERYCGDMLLQKTYVENCITKKVKVNHGEMNKYLITNNHVPIIDRDTFNAVQTEIAKRNSRVERSKTAITLQGKYSGKYALTDLLICGECGRHYRRRTWVSKKGNKKVMWRCLNRVEHGNSICKHSPSVEEFKLHNAICRALSKEIENKTQIYNWIKTLLEYDASGDDNVLEIESIDAQIEEYQKSIDTSMMMQITTSGDKTRYEKEILSLSNKIMILKKRKEDKQKRIKNDSAILKTFKNATKAFETMDDNGITYDDAMIRRLIDHILVMENGCLVIVLKGGYKVEEYI